MKVPSKYLITLEQLGLTRCQAKVYLAAIQNGNISAKKISETTKIARPYVYVIIIELERLGLIEKTVSKHSGIKAIPFETGISSLLQRKKQETRQLTERTKNMIHDFEKFVNKNTKQDYISQFAWLSEKEPYIRKRREEIENAKKSIDFVTTWKRLPLTAFTFGETAEIALKRGVKMRAVIEKPPKEHLLPNTIGNLKKYPNYYLRYLPNSPRAVIGIFDRKRIIVDISPSAGLAECPALWSNNPSLLAMMQDYYDILWITTLKKPKYNVDLDQIVCPL